ncbi:hypothetical protein PaG_00515 [Moesziomyces aphidis]|uniref:Uncharacterized protein n=1 Tax=Moesziomyces aphidis TaxID=84754 RepID=W3VWA3_MOEAP|nr:hypothetical protein PaG_00515 [Moesziomyces aphidis]
MLLAAMLTARRNSTEICDNLPARNSADVGITRDAVRSPHLGQHDLGLATPLGLPKPILDRIKQCVDRVYRSILKAELVVRELRA